MVTGVTPVIHRNISDSWQLQQLTAAATQQHQRLTNSQQQ